MAERYRSTINGGFALCKATNLAGAVQPMIPELKRGATTYLRRTDGAHPIIVFNGFPPEATAYNIVGELTELPDWGDKALRMLMY